MIELDHLSVSGRDERTAFEIGSITKMMTAALFTEIIERGENCHRRPLGDAAAVMISRSCCHTARVTRCIPL